MYVNHKKFNFFEPGQLWDHSWRVDLDFLRRVVSTRALETSWMLKWCKNNGPFSHNFI